MSKSDKDVLYTEVFGAKVGLPQFYDENDNPVAISTENPLPVQLNGAGVEGKSAYDVAVDNGFEGSEQEWLETLKGEQGSPGKDGTDGRDGTDGKDAEPQFTEGEIAAIRMLIE